MKTLLSYTTLHNLHESSHSFINKSLGIEPPTSEAMEKGKAAHVMIQNHVSGKKHIDKLNSLTWKFPTVEYHAKAPYDDQFQLHAFLDGINFASKTFMEVKTSSKPWSQGQFNDLIQAPYYAWVSNMRKCLFVTCTFDLTDIKTYYREFTDEDIERAKKWTEEAIAIITEGRLKEDLEEGHCNNPKCPYKENCFFRI